MSAVTNKDLAIAAATPILRRLGKKFVDWLIRQGLHVFKRRLQTSIKRISRKARRAKRKGKLVLARLRSTRVWWRRELLAWVNGFHAEITEKFTSELMGAEFWNEDFGLGVE